MPVSLSVRSVFFIKDTATTEIYTLSLHDALPISSGFRCSGRLSQICSINSSRSRTRSEEHTSELQSLTKLVCRLLLEKNKKNATYISFSGLPLRVTVTSTSANARQEQPPTQGEAT